MTANQMTPTRARRRHAAAATLAILPLIGLAACSADTAETTNSTAPAATGTAGATTAGTAAGTTTGTAPATATATTPPARVDTPLNLTLTDPDLGHTIKLTRMSRNVPWPAGTPAAQAEAFEIITVDATVTAGSRYSALVFLAQYALRMNNQLYPPTREFPSLPVIGEATSGQTVSGQIVFVVHRAPADQPREFVYIRPEYVVPATGQKLPRWTTFVKIS